MTSTGALVSRYTNTFANVPTLPTGAAIASDKRNNSVFYGGSAGAFYVSTNLGVTFAKTASLGSSTTIHQIRVNPTIAGDVWATTDTGLFHSLDYGTTFTKTSGVTAGYAFGMIFSRIVEPTLTCFDSIRCLVQIRGISSHLRIFHR